MAIKLKPMTTAQSLSSRELEEYNYNLWLIEHALNSVGASTPAPGGGSSTTIGLKHDQLLELLDDDHIQYLLLAGRVGGQRLVWSDFNSPALTVEPNSLETSNRLMVALRGFGGLGLEVFGVTTGNAPNVRVQGIFDIENGGGGVSFRPNASTVDIFGLSIAGGFVFQSKAQVELNAHGRINNLNTASNVVNTNLGVIDGDYWISLQMYVRTAQVGASAKVTLNWNDGLQARQFNMTLPLDVVTVEMNRMLAITKGAGNLTYSLTFTGVTTGRIDVKIKVQRMSS